MLDTILVILVVAAAFGYLGRRVYRHMTAPKSSTFQCSSCPACEEKKPSEH